MSMFDSMVRWIVLLCISLFGISYADENMIGSNLLNNALVHIFEKNNETKSKMKKFYEESLTTDIDFTKSRFRRRCRDYFACTLVDAFYELENVVFYNGEIYLANLDTKSQEDMAEITKFYIGSRPGLLPPMFVHYNGKFDWPVGPKINSYTTIPSNLPTKDGKVACEKIWDTNANFLFPWQPSNAFHALNDNAFYVLTQIVWQFVTSYDTKFGSSRNFADVDDSTDEGHIEMLEAIRQMIPHNRDLFLFDSSPVHRGKGVANTFKILRTLFGTDHIHPAGDVLKGGPHCVSHVTWGNGYKPFYKDVIVEHRKALFSIMHYIFKFDSDIQASLKKNYPSLWGEPYSGYDSYEPDADYFMHKAAYGRRLHDVAADSNATVMDVEPEFRLGTDVTDEEPLIEAMKSVEEGLDSNVGSELNEMAYAETLAAYEEFHQNDNEELLLENLVTTDEETVYEYPIFNEEEHAQLHRALRELSNDAMGRKLKVAIMSRNFEAFRIGRNLTPQSEEAIKKAFEEIGAVVVPCCDYKKVNSVAEAVPYTFDIDVCVGIHGAGLINCGFSTRKVVSIEIQHVFGREFDGFMKAAHVTGGHYINMDIRQFAHERLGYSLKPGNIKDIVSISLKLNKELNDPSVPPYPKDIRNSAAYVERYPKPFMNLYKKPYMDIVSKQSVLGPLMKDAMDVCRTLVYVESPAKSPRNVEGCDKDNQFPPSRAVRHGLIDPGLLGVNRKSELFNS